ncbi:hypothetical protein [Chryseobacterium sp. ISL-6]|nr:hypothetical protein [Chryseobacterium sp. ISL-6]
MKTAILLTLYLLNFTASTRCDQEEDETKNRYDKKIESGTVKSK